MAARLHPLTLTWLLLGIGLMTEGAGQCRRPSGEGMIPAGREFYNVGESLTVLCEIGYRPSRERITCLNPQTSNEWDLNVQCIGRCKRPDVPGMIPVDKDFYNVGESITVRCEAGYRSLHDRTTCTSRQPNDVWDNPPTCIAQCGKPPVEGLISAYKDFYEVGESLPVQCRTGYRPSHERTYCRNPRTESEWEPSSWCIGDDLQGGCARPAGEGLIPSDRASYNIGESLTIQCDPGYRPSRDRISCVIRMSNVDWDHPPQCIGLCEKPQSSEAVYLISGEESSYAVGESLSVYCAPGRHPAQETITCVKPDQWDSPAQCIDSTKGSEHSKGSEHFRFSLDLGSALWIFVPIFTMKLLAILILLKMQCTLMEEDSRRTWTDVFFCKRCQGEVYDDVEEASSSPRESQG